MSVKYRVWKVRRDGVSQRYRVNPSRDYDDAVTALMGGDLATAESREAQEVARQLMQESSVQESIYRSLVRQYPETDLKDAEPMLFLQHYLSRGDPEAEALLVRLATEPSSWNVRSNAIYTITTSMDPRVPRLIREVLDKAPDKRTVSDALSDLAVYFDITMENLISEGIAPAKEAILDTLETLGLALQGKWFLSEGEITFILTALNYERSLFERAVQGQIPDSVEKTVIEGLKSVLALGSLSTDGFERTLGVIKNWESAYSLSKLRSLLSGLKSKRRRRMVTDAINEIEDRLKRKSG